MMYKLLQKSSRAEVLNYSKEQLIDYIIHNYHREQLDMIDEIDQGLAKLLNVHYDHHGEELTKDLSNLFATQIRSCTSFPS